MTSISNMKIGKKIGLVLGINAALLAALAGLSLWGSHTTGALSNETIHKLVQARLAERIGADTTALAQNIALLVIEKKETAEVAADIEALRKERLDAITRYRADAR